MALSGTFSNSYRGFTYQIAWSATQNVSDNYSSLTCTHKLIIAEAYSLKIASRTNSCTVNSDTQTFDSAAINASGSKTITLGTTKHTIKHNSDGTGKFSISSVFNMRANIGGAYNECIVVDGSAILNTIPRASTFGTITGNTIGEPITVNIIRSSSSFTHQFWYKLGNSKWYDLGTGHGSTITFTPDGALQSQLPNSTSGTLELCIRTFNGSTRVGSDVYKNITVYIKGVAPTVGTIVLDPQDINGNNILVQGKNKLNISVSGCTAGTGSTIKSYTFTGPGISTTTTNTSVTSGMVATAGKLTYTVKVTDARGNSTPKTKDIVCYKYAAPYFKSFTSYRCTAVKDTSKTGIDQFTKVTASDKGTYIKCEYTVVYSYVNNTNGVADTNGIVVYGGATNAVYSNWSEVSKTTTFDGLVTISGHAIIENCSVDKTYSVYAVFTDKYGGKVSSSKSKTAGVSKIMNVRAAGDGIAFGKMSETAQVLDSAWPIKSDEPAKTMQNLSYRNPSDSISSITDDKVTNWANQGNLATIYYPGTSVLPNQPSPYGFLLNLTNGPGNTEIHQIWAAQPNDDLYHRAGNASSLNGWKKILDANNYTGYVEDYLDNNLLTYIKACMADYVIAQGKSGNWFYRVWNNGNLEYFGYSNYSETISTPWGSLYYKEIDLPSFPSNIVNPTDSSKKIAFTAIPNVTISLYHTSGYCYISGAINTTKTTCGKVQLMRPDTGSSVSGSVIINAIGKWK